jgi:hypothetical protein
VRDVPLVPFPVPAARVLHRYFIVHINLTVSFEENSDTKFGNECNGVLRWEKLNMRVWVSRTKPLKVR